VATPLPSTPPTRLAGNPILTLLGRQGRSAVVEALRRNPGRTWTVRDLARFADVAPMVASRTVRELSAQGAVDVVRPGRDARIRFLPDSPAGMFLASLEVPDVAAAATQAFADAYVAPRGTTWIAQWWAPEDDSSDPLARPRVAVVGRDTVAALDAAGPALDTVQSAGLPAPDVSAWTAGQLQAEDPVAKAILGGIRLRSR
jgi:hypothetical protein